MRQSITHLWEYLECFILQSGSVLTIYNSFSSTKVYYILISDASWAGLNNWGGGFIIITNSTQVMPEALAIKSDLSSAAFCHWACHCAQDADDYQFTDSANLSSLISFDDRHLSWWYHTNILKIRNLLAQWLEAYLEIFPREANILADNLAAFAACRQGISLFHWGMEHLRWLMNDCNEAGIMTYFLIFFRSTWCAALLKKEEERLQTKISILVTENDHSI